MHTTDPHHAEYLAAASAIHEQTPPPPQRTEPAVGDFISGVTDGRRWSGHVEWDATSTRSIEIDACKRQSPPLRTAKDFLPHMVDEAEELYGGGPGPSKASVERGMVCVNVGGGWVSVPLYDITH